jgi:uncharacterized surface protein with fasciclin (FAS1) repeats
MLKKMKYSLLIFFLAALIAGGCDKRSTDQQYPPGVKDNIITVASQQGNLNTFIAAFQKAGMEADFASLGNYTFIVPTDAAFTEAGITTAVINTLPADALRTILRNHIISGRIRSLDLLPGPNSAYTTIGRDSIFTSTYGKDVYFNGKKIEKVDILANNGILHTINGVLAPPAGNLTATLSTNPNFSLLIAAIARANLTAALNGFSPQLTIFAPTNAAFAAAGFGDTATINATDPAVLSNIIRYHAVQRRLYGSDIFPGTLPTLQGTNITVVSATAVKGTSNTASSAITGKDLIYREGVVHTIDRVLLP